VAGKYRPLTHLLASLPSGNTGSVEFDFAEIASVVGGLPPSAYESRQWWANSTTTQAQSWGDADWHVDHVNFERQRVRYVRGRVGGSYRA
jgi:hypothetical protein